MIKKEIISIFLLKELQKAINLLRWNQIVCISHRQGSCHIDKK